MEEEHFCKRWGKSDIEFKKGKEKKKTFPVLPLRSLQFHVHGQRHHGARGGKRV